MKSTHSWADAEALRRDADAVFKLVGEAHAALASAEKRREFDAAEFVDALLGR